MPEYVAGLCHMQGNELVPFDTKKISADNHDEAVRQAVEWLSSTNTTIDDRTWLQVLLNGSAIFSKEVGRKCSSNASVATDAPRPMRMKRGNAARSGLNGRTSQVKNPHIR
jgi:hypothetical protein